MKVVELTEPEIASIRELLMMLDQRLYAFERRPVMAKEKPLEPKPQFLEPVDEGAEYYSE